MKIILTGACGRMGHQVVQQARETGHQILYGVDQKADTHEYAFPVYPDFCDPGEKADVIIDFSSPALLKSELAWAQKTSTPVLIACTGFSDNDLQLIEEASENIAIFRSANLSLGIEVLKELVRKASAMLEGYDIEIIERHHNKKADAPSGTALILLDAVKNETSEPVFGRHGADCRRKQNEIGIHSVRGGTIVGEHEVDFCGPFETISLTHTAQDRSVFAAGALRAAFFLTRQQNGCYNMADLVRSL